MAHYLAAWNYYNFIATPAFLFFHHSDYVLFTNKASSSFLPATGAPARGRQSYYYMPECLAYPKENSFSLPSARLDEDFATGGS